MDILQESLMNNVTGNLLQEAIKYGWENIKKYFKGIQEDEVIRYKLGYEKYLENTKIKNNKIKTMIYNQIPKDLYSFYENVNVSYENETIKTDKIENLFEIGNKIIITGMGGMGKSLLFKHLFLNTIIDTKFIPILIELRSFNGNSNNIKEKFLLDQLYDLLYNNGFELEKEIFKKSLKEGGYVVFLDGYDEINKDLKNKIENEIKNFTDKYSKNKYFLSSRPTEEFIGWNDFYELEMLKLNKEQALNIIKKIEFDEEVKSIFYKQLDDNLYDKYEPFASNPLLLSIMLLTFQKHAIIPEKLNEFYNEAFVTLFNAHDATKGSYKREIRSELGCEDFKDVFSYICFKSYFNNKYEFSETELNKYLNEAQKKFDKLNFSVDYFQEDLLASVCMLIRDGRMYRFLHRSFQEYFAAYHTCKLLDETQEDLLKNWLKESSNSITDSYFKMLFNLQSEKVEKLVLYPVAKEVRKLYEKESFSLTFLKELFKGVVLKKIEKNNENKYQISLRMKNLYLCRGVKLISQLNNYFDNGVNQEKIELLYDEFINKVGNVNINNIMFNFEEVLKIISEKDLLEITEWANQQVLFAIEKMKKYDNQNYNKSESVSSIIDNL